MFTEADIDRIGRGVETRTLPKPEWTHAAHFAAAFYLLVLGREAEMPSLIRAYNDATGVPNTDTEGYHETITQASLRAARAWLKAHPQLTRADSLDAFLNGPHGHSAWPLAYWSRSVLFSPEARRAWRAPDLQPLPF